MTNPDIPKSPLDQIADDMSDEERARVLDRVEQRAIDRSEDGYHENETTAAQVSGRIATQQSIFRTETFWGIGIGDFTPDYSGDPW